MAFSQYKHIAQVQTKYQIRYEEQTFIIPSSEPSPTAGFLDEIAFNLREIDVYASEGSRSEMLIAPILREIYKSYHERLSFWIQKPLAVDAVLNGTPDYIVSMRSALGKTVLEAPLIICIEAKNNDFTQGWGQCLAELIGAQKFNQRTDLPVHGIVTDGKLWEIGRLVEKSFVKNSESYTIDHLSQLFGALHYLFQAALRELQPA